MEIKHTASESDSSSCICLQWPPPSNSVQLPSELPLGRLMSFGKPTASRVLRSWDPWECILPQTCWTSCITMLVLIHHYCLHQMHVNSLGSQAFCMAVGSFHSQCKLQVLKSLKLFNTMPVSPVQGRAGYPDSLCWPGASGHQKDVCCQDAANSCKCSLAVVRQARTAGSGLKWQP